MLSSAAEPPDGPTIWRKAKTNMTNQTWQNKYGAKTRTTRKKACINGDTQCAYNIRQKSSLFSQWQHSCRYADREMLMRLCSGTASKLVHYFSILVRLLQQPVRQWYALQYHNVRCILSLFVLRYCIKSIWLLITFSMKTLHTVDRRLEGAYPLYSVFNRQLEPIQ